MLREAGQTSETAVAGRDVTAPDLRVGSTGKREPLRRPSPLTEGYGGATGYRSENIRNGNMRSACRVDVKFSAESLGDADAVTGFSGPEIVEFVGWRG